jgi:hypothetical protein
VDVPWVVLVVVVLSPEPPPVDPFELDGPHAIASNAIATARLLVPTAFDATRPSS